MRRFERRFAPSELPHAKAVIGACVALAALMLYLLLAGCASVPNWERVAIGAEIADITTTAYALSVGGSEINPLLDRNSDTETIVTTVALTALTHWILRRIARNITKQRSDQAWRAIVVIHGGAAAWNLREIVTNE